MLEDFSRLKSKTTVGKLRVSAVVCTKFRWILTKSVGDMAQTVRGWCEYENNLLQTPKKGIYISKMKGIIDIAEAVCHEFTNPFNPAYLPHHLGATEDTQTQKNVLFFVKKHPNLPI